MSQSIPNPLSVYNIVDNDMDSRSFDDSLVTLPDEENLNEYRREIKQEIDEVTSFLLSSCFSYSAKSRTVIINSHQWQQKIKNLVAQRATLNYPYVLVTSDEINSTEHIEIQSPQELCDLYIEWFTFESEEVFRGSQLKGQLSYLDEEELNEFYDDRIMGPEYY